MSVEGVEPLVLAIRTSWTKKPLEASFGAVSQMLSPVYRRDANAGIHLFCVQYVRVDHV